MADAFWEAQGEAKIATKPDIERLAVKLDVRSERMDGEFRLNRRMIGVLLAGVVSLVLKAFFIEDKKSIFALSLYGNG